MATQRLNLTRDQLATFLKNHEQIKQFERLFQIADEVSPETDTQGISIQAGNAEAVANLALALIASLAQDAAINSGNADQKATQALDNLARIANVLEMLATAPVIQNNNSVVTDYIDLPEIGPHVTQARRLQWNQDDGTLDIGQYGGVVLQAGQELQYYAKNTSGAPIPIGTPVMFTGTIGSSGKLTFGPAIANGSVLADYMMGVTAHTIPDNDFGYVISFGLLKGFDTTGAPYGEVWTDGDLLYFGTTAPGTWTNVPPQAPNIDVPVAVVVNAGAGGSGSIFIRMTVAEALTRLQDVYISGLANGDLLQYDSVQQRWENVPASTLPVGTATNLAGGAAGSVPYQTGPGATTFTPIGTAGQVFRVNGTATAPEWVSPAALSKVDDTNVTLTLGGSPTTALLASASLTLGWTGQLSLARGGTNANLTASAGSVAYSTASGLALNTAGSTGNWLRSAGTGAPVWTAPAALTKTDDTNVTLTLGGSASTALLNAASLTLGWTGQLAATRGGTGIGSYVVGDILYANTTTTLDKLPIGASGRYLSSSGTAPQWSAPAALTKTDDTNVTLTLGGSASTALLNAASITVGWTGTLATGRGGTGQSSYTAGDLLYYVSGTSLTKLAIGSANRVLTSSGSAPQWSTSLALAGSFSCASNALVGTTSAAGITGNGLSVNSGSVGTNGTTCALALYGTGGDFYAQNWRDSSGNYFYDLLVFSAATDYMYRAYRNSGGTVTGIYAAYANGDFQVYGALSKGSGSFRIEHPHPALSETHDLVHSFIEGPQADLIYRGTVKLVDGKAQVNIDKAAKMREGTFVLLCRDVQCFTSNETDWTNVRGKVAGNILSIEAQDQQSIATVSWMVIGERQDKHMMNTDWTDDNGKVIVEPLKRNPHPEPIYPQGAEQ